MNIALLFGGRGAEHAVSVRSAAAVLPRLIALGHRVTPVGVAKTGALFRYTGDAAALSEDFAAHSTPLSLRLAENTLFFETADGERFAPDLVFSVLHGKDGEDGVFQGVFSLGNIPFVGSGVCASAITMNKRITKALVRAAGIPTVPDVTARVADEALSARVSKALRYPLFVKPVSGGSSIGVSRVAEEEDLLPAVRRALAECEEALIEEAVEGSELEVAVLSHEDTLLLSPPGEIRTEGGFYDYDTKYLKGGARITLPAPLSLWETAYVKQLAATAFRALGCRDYARVDFLRRRDGRIFFNEINTLPGFTEDSLFPRLFSLIGVDPLLFLTEGRA